MPLIRQIHFEDINILEDRQRKEYKAEAIIDLAGSISQVGLLHPPVFRTDEVHGLVLLCGFRRIKALEYIWNFGEKVKCAGKEYDEFMVPFLHVGDMTAIDAEEAELDENLKRENLTWQDLARTQARLMRLRAAQAARDGKPDPTIKDIVEEVASMQGTKDKGGEAYRSVRQNILLDKYLTDPEVAKARTADDAFKLLKRREESERNARLATEVGRTLTAASHTLLHGDCTELLPLQPDSTVDVILSDPPYGIDAQEFSDSGGHAGGGTSGAHFYDDSVETWRALMRTLGEQFIRITKPQAHLYLFCDIDRFHELKDIMTKAGFKCFRTPMIWHNPTSNRAPWPEMGPHRKYQCVLYAVKGSRPVTKLYPDVITQASDPNLGHHAQKPVQLFVDLLRRSVAPGNTILDPFCGTGTIFPAAYELKCIATGIEMDASAAGIAMTRLKELK